MPASSIITWDSVGPDFVWDSPTLTWDAPAPETNSNMPVQNISAQFTAQGFTDLKTDIVALNPQFPTLVTLTDAERNSLQRVASGREAFCETAITGAETFPTVVPSYLSLVEWQKDETYAEQLAETEVLIAALLAKIRDTRSAVGAERYRQSRKFYEAVKAAKEDVPGLQALYDTLSEQFEGQGPNGGTETPTPEGQSGQGTAGNPGTGN
jgi:hypothetical protein